MSYENVEGGDIPIKAWTIGVPFEHAAKAQLRYCSMLPFVRPHIAVMPDVHYGAGSTVGSVIPTVKAIIPATVGVDLGCGMIAVKTDLTSHQISDNGQELFDAIAEAIPVGSGKKSNEGSWDSERHLIPDIVKDAYRNIEPQIRKIIDKHGQVSHKRILEQLSTLGSGNHFCSVALDESDFAWIVIHSGSRGIGNNIGRYFIDIAKKEMDRLDRQIPNRDLAYLEEGTEYFNDYVEAVLWAQDYAKLNRELMMELAIKSVRSSIKKFNVSDIAIQCHHNFVQKEDHFGQSLWITRKGAVQAKKDQLGIIPGSMGGKIYIVKGKGNKDSFETCSHGAGRNMSRTVAKQSITLEMHREATEGVFCRKDKGIIDESPAAYKDIDVVMAAQDDLIEVVHTLKEMVNVKG
jgi:tRNA-splicing ligase RtcB